MGGLLPFENINLVYRDDFNNEGNYFQKIVLHDKDTFPISEVDEIRTTRIFRQRYLLLVWRL